MSGFPIVDLVVGMIFLYFLLSIISSSVVEMLLSVFKLRSEMLSKWLLTIFDKEISEPNGKVIKLGSAIMDHCITTGLSKRGQSTSFIDAKNFASALIERITYDKDAPLKVAGNIDDIINSITSTQLLSPELQRTFLTFATEAKEAVGAIKKKTYSEIQLFRNKIERWYDSSMDRIEGSLKTKYTRPFTFWIGVVIVVCLNADSVALSKYLYYNPDARAKLAAQANATINDTAIINQINQLRNKRVQDTATISQQNALVEIRQNQLLARESVAAITDSIPLGWQEADLIKLIKLKDLAYLLTKLGGLLATTLAIMLGAPFWFDLLNKIANIRGSGPKPAPTADITQKDPES